MTDLAVAHDSLRPLLFSIAYRMLGSVSDAEDVVQDALLKIHQADTEIENLEAFATTVTTRLAIDALRSARRRRETYIGPWLPEPLLDADPAHRITLDESVSYAFLVLLERLTPVERAVFLLREVYGYDYADIASIVGKSEPACRQQFSRAKAHLADGRVRFDPSEEERAVAERFFTAMRTADMAALERLLAEDVTFYGDGGGKAPAVRQPVHGLVQVARFLHGLARQGVRWQVTFEADLANGQPAARLVTKEGELIGVTVLDIAGGRVRTVRNQINPDKLRHLGRVGDINAVRGD